MKLRNKRSQYESLRSLKHFLDDVLALLLAPLYFLYVLAMLAYAVWLERKEGRKTQRWQTKGWDHS
jgi:hypothetical protein